MSMLMTLEECEAQFKQNFEDNLDTWDKLTLLRSCIELLDRLENTPYDAFAGKVLIFLSKAIPLFDQSGTNGRSEFSAKELPTLVTNNLEQNCAKATENGKNQLTLTDHDMEEGETLSDEDINETCANEDPFKTYERFWRVVKFLNSPNMLYDKNFYYNFRTNVDALLSKMENTPASIKVWKLSKTYMAQPSTFTLQLSDINMRRCFLLQILMVIQYLEMPVDFRPDSYSLDKNQLAWLSSVEKRIFAILETMPNPEEGSKFTGLVRHLLEREEIWNRWKDEKCKEPVQPPEEEEPVNMRSTYHKRRKIGDELASAKPYNMHVIGSQEMSRLWNKKPSEKFNTPDLNKYLNIPEERQTELFKDPNYSFKLLRLLRKSPHFFAQSSAAIVSLDEYLRIAATRHSNKPKT